MVWFLRWLGHFALKVATPARGTLTEDIVAGSGRLNTHSLGRVTDGELGFERSTYLGGTAADRA